MHDTDPTGGRRQPHTPRLRELQRRSVAYLEFLRDSEPWLEQVADVNRLRDSGYAFLLDEIRAAQRAFPALNGSPAAIARMVGELLGEVTS